MHVLAATGRQYARGEFRAAKPESSQRTLSAAGGRVRREGDDGCRSRRLGRLLLGNNSARLESRRHDRRSRTNRALRLGGRPPLRSDYTGNSLLARLNSGTGDVRRGDRGVAYKTPGEVLEC